MSGGLFRGGLDMARRTARRLALAPVRSLDSLGRWPLRKPWLRRTVLPSIPRPLDAKVRQLAIGFELALARDLNVPIRLTGPVAIHPGAPATVVAGGDRR